MEVIRGAASGLCCCMAGERVGPRVFTGDEMGASLERGRWISD